MLVRLLSVDKPFVLIQFTLKSPIGAGGNVMVKCFEQELTELCPFKRYPDSTSDDNTSSDNTSSTIHPVTLHLTTLLLDVHVRQYIYMWFWWRACTYNDMTIIILQAFTNTFNARQCSFQCMQWSTCNFQNLTLDFPSLLWRPPWLILYELICFPCL